MFGLTRWNAFEDIFNFQREVDRVFNQFWSDLPARTQASATSLNVTTTDDGWRMEIPMPGIDPDHVVLEVAGNTLSIRAEEPAEKGKENVVRYEQTLTLPQFLDVDKVSASHRHGMLELTIPLKESVKPRRIQIAAPKDEKKQLVGA